MISICVVALFVITYYFLFSIQHSKTLGKKVPENPVYLDKNKSDEERIKNLIFYMSLEEKIGQMALVEKNSIQEPEDISTFGIGGVLSGFGGKPENNTADGWKQMVNEFTESSK